MEDQQAIEDASTRLSSDLRASQSDHAVTMEKLDQLEQRAVAEVLSLRNAEAEAQAEVRSLSQLIQHSHTERFDTEARLVDECNAATRFRDSYTDVIEEIQAQGQQYASDVAAMRDAEFACRAALAAARDELRMEQERGQELTNALTIAREDAQAQLLNLTGVLEAEAQESQEHATALKRLGDEQASEAATLRQLHQKLEVNCQELTQKVAESEALTSEKTRYETVLSAEVASMQSKLESAQTALLKEQRCLAKQREMHAESQAVLEQVTAHEQTWQKQVAALDSRQNIVSEELSEAQQQSRSLQATLSAQRLEAEQKLVELEEKLRSEATEYGDAVLREDQMQASLTTQQSLAAALQQKFDAHEAESSNQVESLSHELATLTSATSRAEQAVQLHEIALLHARDQVQQLTKELENHEAKSAVELESARKSEARLSNELAELHKGARQEKEAATVQRTVLLEELTAAEDARANLEQQHSTSLAAKAVLESRLQNSVSEVERKQIFVAQLEEELAERDVAIRGLESVVASSKSDMADYAVQLTQLTSSRAQVEASLEQRLRHIEASAREEASLHAARTVAQERREKDLETDLKLVRKEVTDTRDRLASEQSIASARLVAEKVAETQLQNLEVRITDLQQQVSNSSSRQAAAVEHEATTLAELRAKLDDARAQLLVSQAAATEARVAAQSARTERAEVEEHMRLCRSETAAAGKKTVEVETVLARCENRQEFLETQLRGNAAQVEALSVDLAESRSNAQNSLFAERMAEKSLAHCESEAHSWRAESEARIVEAIRQASVYSATIEDLRAKLAVAETELKQSLAARLEDSSMAAGKLQALDQEGSARLVAEAAAQARCKTLQQTTDVLRSELDKQIDHARAEAQAAAVSEKAWRNELAEISKEHSVAVAAQVQQAGRMHTAATEERESMLARVDTLNRELEQAELERRDLVHTVATSTNELTTLRNELQTSRDAAQVSAANATKLEQELQAASASAQETVQNTKFASQQQADSLQEELNGAKYALEAAKKEAVDAQHRDDELQAAVEQCLMRVEQALPTFKFSGSHGNVDNVTMANGGDRTDRKCGNSAEKLVRLNYSLLNALLAREQDEAVAHDKLTLTLRDKEVEASRAATELASVVASLQSTLDIQTQAFAEKMSVAVVRSHLPPVLVASIFGACCKLQFSCFDVP